jgi:hypothetical protein
MAPANLDRPAVLRRFALQQPIGVSGTNNNFTRRLQKTRCLANIHED